MVVVRARAWLGLGSVVAPPAPRSAHLSCHGRNWSPHRFLASRRGRLVQGYLGRTCTAHGPVHAVGKESCAPPYCAPSPTRTYLGTGDHLGERRRASRRAPCWHGGAQYMPLSARVSRPWHLAQVVLSLSSKGPPISPPMSAISPWPTRRAVEMQTATVFVAVQTFASGTCDCFCCCANVSPTTNVCTTTKTVAGCRSRLERGSTFTLHSGNPTRVWDLDERARIAPQADPRVPSDAA